MDVAPVSAQSLGAVVVPQSATPGAVHVPSPLAPPPGPAKSTAPSARRQLDTVQISPTARHAAHRAGSHRGSGQRGSDSNSTSSVDGLATQDEAALSDLADTYRQAFGDRLQALGFAVPDASTTTPSPSATPATTDDSPSPTVTPPPDASTSTTTSQTTPSPTDSTATTPTTDTTTAAGVADELAATLKKLQANADKSIELAAAGVPTGNDHTSRFAQFKALRQIGYVTDLTRAAMQHAKQVADYTLDHLPQPADTAGPSSALPPTTPTPTPAPTPAPSPTPTTTPTPTPTVTPPPTPTPAPTPTPTVTPPPSNGNSGNGNSGTPNPSSGGSQVTVSQINALRRSAQMQLHQLALDTAKQAARIEQSLDDQLAKFQDAIAGDLSNGSGSAGGLGWSQGGDGSSDPFGGLRMNGGNPPRAGNSPDWTGWLNQWTGPSGSSTSSGASAPSDPTSGNTSSNAAASSTATGGSAAANTATTATTTQDASTANSTVTSSS